jgi:hypothetical protein
MADLEQPVNRRCRECGRKHGDPECVPLSDLAHVPEGKAAEVNPTWSTPQKTDGDREIAVRLAQIQRERRAEQW